MFAVLTGKVFTSGCVLKVLESTSIYVTLIQGYLGSGLSLSKPQILVNELCCIQ